MLHAIGPAGYPAGPLDHSACDVRQRYARTLVRGGDGAGAEPAGADDVGGQGDEGQPPDEDDDADDAGGDAAEELEALVPGFADFVAEVGAAVVGVADGDDGAEVDTDGGEVAEL